MYLIYILFCVHVWQINMSDNMTDKSSDITKWHTRQRMQPNKLNTHPSPLCSQINEIHKQFSTQQLPTISTGTVFFWKYCHLLAQNNSLSIDIFTKFNYYNDVEKSLKNSYFDQYYVM